MYKGVEFSLLCNIKKMHCVLFIILTGGKTNEQRALFDMLQDEVMDLRNGFVKLCYGASFVSNT